MSRPIVIAFALALATVATASPALAQDGMPDTENGRYSFNRIDDDYLRLDQRTGQVSVCSRRKMAWSCHLVPDERTALEDEIARLQKDNAALKRQMLAHGITPPGGPSAQPDKPTAKSPSEQELDSAMEVMERLWKRLVEIVQRWQRELAPI